MAAKRLFTTSCGRRAGASLVLATVLVGVGVMASSTGARPEGSVGVRATPVGAFACDRVDPSSPIPSRGVVVQDQFGIAKTVTTQLVQLCAPARFGGGVFVNPRAHLACYLLKQRPFVSRTVVISNTFESAAQFKVLRPIQLCLPSGKSVQPSPPPAPVKGLSHYQCYAVEAQKPLTPRRVVFVDQFGKVSAVVLSATSLCAPVSKNKSPVYNKATHLVCYPFKAVPAFQGKHLTLTNQFGSPRLAAFRRDSICLPSVKRLVAPRRPDLTVAIDKTHNPSVSCNTSGCVTTVTFTVSNIGAADVTIPYTILVEADPSLAVSKTVPGPLPVLAGAPGQTLSVQVGPAGACYDPDCTVRVTVDSGNAVAESNEANNTDTFTGIG
jgi:hypothetical protein